MSLLRGTAFITGGASGIGRSTALSFAKNGVQKLAIADLNFDEASRFSSDLNGRFAGIEAFPINLDVTKEESINDAVSEMIKRCGRLDYAINCAGFGGYQDLSVELASSNWRKVISINLNGLWMCSKAEIRAQLKQEKQVGSGRHNRGVIVNVASMLGVVATSSTTSNVAYTAAKHGVVGVTKADATAYAAKDIRINAICPGYVSTPLIDKVMDQKIRLAETGKIPLQRFADVEEIADCITFLASPMSSYMQGTALVADGGFTIQ